MAQPLTPPFVALDLERTGIDADRDAIIEVAAVRFRDGEVIEELQRLVRPTVDIPLRVQQITGLDAAQLADAPSVTEVMAELREFVGEQPLVGQSIGFDLEFLRRQGGPWRQPAIDTFELASILVPEARRYGLGNLVNLLGLSGPATHRALDDARAHMLLFEALLERARRLPTDTLGTINRLAERAGWDLAPFFALAARGASPIEEHVPPFKAPSHGAPSGSHVEIDARAVESVLAPGGALAARIEGYEDRPAQREMLRHVTQAFNESDHLLVEAGTGTGKSLAYLLPAAAWAMANRRPVVIATHTIPLQDQLLDKDLPLVGELLGGEPPLRAAVLKGRNHYLCRTRLARLATRDDLDVDDARAVAKLLVWAPRTRTGDRAELLILPEDERVWRLANAEGDSCRPERCRHAARGDCWLQRARQAAETAHVLVVNHALLISDLLTENRLLPRHRHLVVDEAHHLEDVATSSLGFRAADSTLFEALAPLAGGGKTAIVPRLREALRLGPVPEQAADDLRAAAAAMQAAARRADRATVDFFAELEAFYTGNDGARVIELRLSDGLRRGAEWMMIEQSWDGLREPLGEARAAGARLQQALVAVEEHLSSDEPLVADLGAAVRGLANLRTELDRVIAAPQNEDITWLARRRGKVVALHRAPLHVGDLLARRLFGDKQTLVLTSATLRAPDFDFVRDRLGLPDAAATTIASPFDYSRQCLLALPSGIPEPNRPGYDQAVASAITSLARAANGRTLALFTSHSGLRKVYHALRAPLGREGIAVIGQGLDGSRHSLLSALREPDGPTVLLGTRSFWEGVDLPGDALSCLVIARLPFGVPSDPVYAARAETFDEPFIDYAVPQALLRFRQGFGRLVRTASDRGVVAVLDGRVRGRRYGDLFIDALPACQRFDGGLDTLGLAARRFIAGEPSFDGYAAALYNSESNQGGWEQ